ncbi:unnamed protein product [Cylicocyclus nassatus]|uniref:Uncharacterized protein n=1 Tax=Cylicocyclus nassatus TaxID=53992 RepID=A0AA36GRR5_CYLNA|nr:unnamed protein product [Cylicocyclus nassatus]
MAQQAQDEERPRRLISRLIERISKHEKSTQHSQCLEEFKKEADDISGRITLDDISATVTSTFAAYVIAKEGLPFSKQFPLLIMSDEIWICRRHCSSRFYYCRMISAFAVHMKYDLVKYVIKNNLPFSFLLDGSSSSRGVKWIVFLLRTLSTDYHLMTLHFSLTEVESESATHIVEALLQVFASMEGWVNEPGLSKSFKQHAMQKMLALSSDGAAVMSGHVQGVFAKLKDIIAEETKDDLYPRNNLIISVCMAHKLNLVVKAQKGPLFKLAQAIVMDLYHLFGSTVRTTGRSVYKKAAQKMCFPDLQMSALFTVRWSASFANSLSNILRVYPVILQALADIRDNRRFSSSLIKRATSTFHVLSDARTYIALHHANTTMHELSVLSQYMQSEEGLLVDNLQKFFARPLLRRDDEERQQLLDWHLFRDLARPTFYEESPPDLDNPELTFSLEDAPESSEGDLRHYSLAKRYEDFDWNNAVYSSIERFYDEMKQALDAQLVNKPHEFNSIDLLAFDKHIILDVIEFNGVFENGFVDYVPTNANFFNRGCPSYFIMEGDILDPNLRQQQILDSTEVLSQFCNIPDLKDSMIASIILYLAGSGYAIESS